MLPTRRLIAIITITIVVIFPTLVSCTIPSLTAFSNNNEQQEDEEEPHPFTLVSTLDGSLHAYSPLTKSLLWSTNCGGTTIKSYQDSSSLDPIGLVVPGSDGSIYVQNPSKELQRFPISVPEFVEQGPLYQVLPNGRRLAIVGSTESRVFQLNAETGNVLRVFDSKAASDQDDDESPPITSNSDKPHLLISRHDFRVRAFDEESGKEVWNFSYGVLNTPLLDESLHHHHHLSTQHDASTEVDVNRLVLPDGLVQLYATPKRRQNKLLDNSNQVAPYQPLSVAKIIESPQGMCSEDDDICRRIAPGSHRVTVMNNLEGLAKISSPVLISLPAPPISMYNTNIGLFLLVLFSLLTSFFIRLFNSRSLAQPSSPQTTTPAATNSIIIHHSKVKGFGCNGTIVFEGTFQNRPVAVKRMQSALYDKANKEVDLLIQSEGHLNVVRYLAKEETSDFVYLALELCQMTLDQAIDQFRKDPMTLANLDKLPPNVQPGDYTRLFLKEIASATEHLHNNGIVHCDIKPQNVLVVPRGNGSSQLLELGGKWIPKLSDMGLSKSLEREKSSFRMTASATHGGTKSNGGGTIGWRAPELLKDQDRSHVTKKIDVFSLGCLFFYLLENGSHPFGEWLVRESNVVNGNPVELNRILVYSGEAYTLIAKMLNPRSEQRPSMANTLHDPFLWNAKTRLDFLCDVSDRLELDSTLGIGTDLTSRVFGSSSSVTHDWAMRLDPVLQTDIASLKHRRYDVHSVRDLLRYIRNRRHHRDEDSKVSDVLTHDPNVFLDHFVGPMRFPNLIPVCVDWLIQTLFIHEPHFAVLFGYEPTISTSMPQRNFRGWMGKDWNQQGNKGHSMPPAPKTPVWKTLLCEHWERSGGMSCVMGDDCGYAHGLIELRISPFDVVGHQLQQQEQNSRQLEEKKKNKKKDQGWYDENWTSVVTDVQECIVYPNGTKRILCDHWERSGGTRCVMGDKCGFAHGLVELKGDGLNSSSSAPISKPKKNGKKTTSSSGTMQSAVNS